MFKCYNSVNAFEVHFFIISPSIHVPFLLSYNLSSWGFLPVKVYQNFAPEELEFSAVIFFDTTDKPASKRDPVIRLFT